MVVSATMMRIWPLLGGGEPELLNEYSNTVALTGSSTHAPFWRPYALPSLGASGMPGVAACSAVISSFATWNCWRRSLFSTATLSGNLVGSMLLAIRHSPDRAALIQQR